LARRKVRLRNHIIQGKSVGEICDIEGLDRENQPKLMRREIAAPEGLKISSERNTAPPVGLLEIERSFRGWLQVKLASLRDHHHYADVAHMVGLTNIEQQRAMTAPYTHNWTIAQIQRLAAAHNMTFAEMVTFASQPPLGDALRRRKT
jgi:hypothetical protein